MVLSAIGKLHTTPNTTFGGPSPSQAIRTGIEHDQRHRDEGRQHRRCDPREHRHRSGVVAGSVPVLARIAAPVLSALIAVPLVVLYPVLIAWLGLGPASKVVFGVVSGIFPIALNTTVGVREINRGYATMAAAMGANRRQIMFQVMAPLALPAIVSGLRLGTALIVIGVVLSEMLASTDGIGFWISYHRALFNTGQVYLGILLALLIAGLANAALSLVERLYARRTVDQAVP